MLVHFLAGLVLLGVPLHVLVSLLDGALISHHSVTFEYLQRLSVVSLLSSHLGLVGAETTQRLSLTVLHLRITNTRSVISTKIYHMSVNLL